MGGTRPAQEDGQASSPAPTTVANGNGNSHVTLTLDQQGEHSTKGDIPTPIAPAPSMVRPGAPSFAKKPSLHRLQSNAALLRDIPRDQRLVLQFSNVQAYVPVMFAPAGAGGGSVMDKVKGLLPGGSKAPPAPALKGAPSFSAPSASAAGAPPGAGASTSAPKERQVLYDLCGCVEPGEMLALMGPSGGGKSSLLAVLGGRSTARTQGSILFNGLKMNKAIKRKMGYVMQDDLLFADLTVYETLYFAAMLRLPRKWSKEDKLARVEMVIAGLGLERCRDTIIGSHMRRGVSGGERKRVSIGHELLINPSVVFLDEPTSGLDSTTALRLLHTLRSLAHGGRTIITSIHQPSSRLYRQMDKLMLLSEGHCMYYGDAKLVVTWFERLGQACPFGTNIADHILDLANGDVALPGTTGSVGAHLNRLGTGVDGDLLVATGDSAAAVHQQLVEAFEKRTIGLGRHGIQKGDLKDDDSTAASSSAGGSSGDLTSKPSAGGLATNGLKSPSGGHGNGLGASASTTARKQAMDSVYESAGAGAGDASVALDGSGDTDLPPGEGRDRDQRQQDGEEDEEEEEASGSRGDKWGASWVDQVKHLTVRCVKTRRFTALSHQKFIQLLVVALLSGCFWWQIGGTLKSEQQVLDIGGLLFFIQLFMAFASLFAALFTFPAEFQMLVKERQSGMYRLSAYYLARTLSDLPMDCMIPSLFVWIIYWMTGLRISAGAFFGNWLSTLLIVLVAQSIGLLIGATVMDPQNGQTISTIFMLATMLVGGYYVRGIPVWISWMKYISFIYWGWNLLVKTEFQHAPYPCSLIVDDDGIQTADAADAQASGQGCDVADADIFDIDVDQTVGWEILFLMGLLVVLRLAVYYALAYKTKFKPKRDSLMTRIKARFAGGSKAT